MEHADIGQRARVGFVAGAAGTAALNVATYLDMAVRGRPPSLGEWISDLVQRAAYGAVTALAADALIADAE